MKVRLATLADAANIAFGNKLNILGAFSAVGVTAFPMLFAQYVLALRLEITYDDGGKPHRLGVMLRDGDGMVVFRAVKNLNAIAVRPGQQLYHDEILVFNQMQFLKPGVLMHAILWDDQVVEEVRLEINLTTGN